SKCQVQAVIPNDPKVQLEATTKFRKLLSIGSEQSLEIRQTAGLWGFYHTELAEKLS
ncbi:unnamed protein product, partial [Urochloa humidicola]